MVEYEYELDFDQCDGITLLSVGCIAIVIDTETHL